jgi:predicted membrane channel-forming protein YqfA (hemolysin III family)
MHVAFSINLLTQCLGAALLETNCVSLTGRLREWIGFQQHSMIALLQGSAETSFLWFTVYRTADQRALCMSWASAVISIIR